MPQIPVVGELNSSWWRCMRFLLEDGKPLPPLIRLAIGPTPKGTRPFGTICKTQNRRLIFWPPLEKGLPAPSTQKPHVITDHLTLDLWSGQSHPTWYDASGKRTSPKKALGWQLEPVHDTGVAHWFSSLIQRSVIEDQDCEVHADVPCPPTDAHRRTGEMQQHWARSSQGDVSLPPPPYPGNYVLYSVFVGRFSQEYSAISRFLSALPLFEAVQHGGQQEGCIPEANILTVEDTRLLIVTACPAGTLTEKNIIYASSAN